MLWKVEPPLEWSDEAIFSVEKWIFRPWKISRLEPEFKVALPHFAAVPSIYCHTGWAAPISLQPGN